MHVQSRANANNRRKIDRNLCNEMEWNHQKFNYC